MTDATQQTHPTTTIEADPDLPTIRITREFEAPRSQVYRAWVDPTLVAKWLGPRSISTTIEQWNPTTGGSYRYSAHRGGEEIARFFGSFHEVRPDERLVQTFTYEGFPDGVSLDTATFEDAGEGRTRVTILSVVDTMEAREMILASGMESGVVEGYEKLDELLG